MSEKAVLFLRIPLVTKSQVATIATRYGWSMNAAATYLITKGVAVEESTN